MPEHFTFKAVKNTLILLARQLPFSSITREDPSILKFIKQGRFKLDENLKLADGLVKLAVHTLLKKIPILLPMMEFHHYEQNFTTTRYVEAGCTAGYLTYNIYRSYARCWTRQVMYRCVGLQ